MEQVENVLDKAVLLSLSVHRFGISKKVKSSEVQSDASPEMIRVSKKILDSADYDNIVKKDGEFARLLADLALPSMFRAGVYAVPLALLDRVDNELAKYLAQRELLIGAFLRVYAQARTEAETLLGSLYDTQNYPSEESVRSAFSVDYKYVSTSVPEKLRQIRADIYTRESARARAEVQSMTENINLLLTQSMRDMLSHLTEKLTPKPDGTAKIFRDSAINNIREFLSTFPARNIGNADDLAAVCSEIDGMLMGITPDALRQDETLREDVRQSFEGITASLDQMLVDRPKRKIRTMEREAVNVQ